MPDEDDVKGQLVSFLAAMPPQEAEKALRTEGGQMPRASGVPADTTPFPTQEQVRKWQPRRLTAKHRQMLSLFAQGVSRREIGALCKCAPEYVTMLAATDLGRAYLKEIEEHLDARMRGLYSKTIDAIEDQLDKGTGANKVAAAKLQLQVTGKLGRAQEETETAEDVIQRILQMNVQGDVNIQVNNTAKE